MITEIIIGVLVLLLGGSIFRGNAQKKRAEKQAERAEKAEVEGVLLKEQNDRLTKIQKIKDDAYAEERKIENSTNDDHWGDLGANGVHDGTASSDTSDL